MSAEHYVSWFKSKQVETPLVNNGIASRTMIHTSLVGYPDPFMPYKGKLTQTIANTTISILLEIPLKQDKKRRKNEQVVVICYCFFRKLFIRCSANIYAKGIWRIRSVGFL